MDLSAQDLAVAIQTLHHSLAFRGQHGFMYSEEERTRVMNRFGEILDSTKLGVSVETESIPPTV